MSGQPTPVFDANSTLFQNIGLLKVAETATRKHGDKVMIQASEARHLYLLAGSDSVEYWRRHQTSFQTDLGDIASNAAITRMLLGEQLQNSCWSNVWMLTANRLASTSRLFDEWLDNALIAATQAFLGALPQDGGSVDLRDLCRDWSIRAVCPAIFGRSLGEGEIAEGIAQVESFYFAMSTRNAGESGDHESLPEFIAARGFLDRVITAALDNSKVGDDTLIAHINEIIPVEVGDEDRLNLLRPTIGRMITEKLNIGGLSLLWILSHLARDPKLVEEIAVELEGKDIYALAEEQTPLAYSVVQEGLRLYPELPFIYRIASQDVVLGPLMIPAKATVVFAPWLVQRDARYWDAPATFDGHRFFGQAHSRDCYFPFGVGPRIRSRARFILHQLTIAVRAICANTTMTLADDCPRGNLHPILRSALIPRGAIPVSFRSRTTGA
jgi:cytochrome P450